MERKSNKIIGKVYRLPAQFVFKMNESEIWLKKAKGIPA